MCKHYKIRGYSFFSGRWWWDWGLCGEAVLMQMLGLKQVNNVYTSVNWSRDYKPQARTFLYFEAYSLIVEICIYMYYFICICLHACEGTWNNPNIKVHSTRTCLLMILEYYINAAVMSQKWFDLGSLKYSWHCKGSTSRYKEYNSLGEVLCKPPLTIITVSDTNQSLKKLQNSNKNLTILETILNITVKPQ